MPMNLTRKIISAHLTKPSDMNPGDEIYVKFDQTLTHDINAVMCYLALEGMGIKRVRTDVSVSYLDHNLLYVNTNTPDDHIFLTSIARKSWHLAFPPGQRHHAQRAVRPLRHPGQDQPWHRQPHHHRRCYRYAGYRRRRYGRRNGHGWSAIRLKMPKVVRVNLTGRLRPGCSGKDVILEMLRRYSVKGGLGRVYEYVGPGVETMEVPERATIANMGAELGATGSIFPADETVRRFFIAQDREKDFVEMKADEGCDYDEYVEIGLSELEPLMSCPHSPDNVKKVKDVEKKPVQQVFIGSCTNGSYTDIARAALVFKGRHVNENVSCVCGIATRQIYKQLLHDGYLDMLVDAGVRLIEIACGPCCGIGQTPATNGISVRTSNRNFKGRSGSANAQLYLVSPETAAATAVAGTFTTAEEVMGAEVSQLAAVHEPEHYFIDDSMFIKPLPDEELEKVEIIRGPNIKPLPIPEKPEENLDARISLKAGDNITTDDITPASAEFSSMRSNMPLMAQYAYCRYDPEFSKRAQSYGKSIIIGGENYGQGSSREHAAITPMFLGVKAVIAKSMARIHKNNLINHGIVPMVFADPADYDKLELSDELSIPNFREQIKTKRVTVVDKTKGISFDAVLELSDDEVGVILEGGQLRYVQEQLKKA